MNTLFIETEWNKYVEKVNKKIIDLDGDSDAQFKLILKTRTDMQNKGFRTEQIHNWTKGQMILTNNHKHANMFDFEMLYPSKNNTFNIDASVLKDFGYQFNEDDFQKSLDELRKEAEESVLKQYKERQASMTEDERNEISEIIKSVNETITEEDRQMITETIKNYYGIYR